jgi:hypothetical protein
VPYDDAIKLVGLGEDVGHGDLGGGTAGRLLPDLGDKVVLVKKSIPIKKGK